MGLAFDAPGALLLLVPALAITILLHLGARRRIGTFRRRAALAVRVGLLAALVFALAGVQLILPVDRLSTVFVVDLSDSVGSAGREEAVAFIRDSLEAMPDGDVAGVVAFGGDALVERLPSDVRDLARIASTPLRGATDVGAALRLADALFPDDAQKRIVLLSDGNDTTGGGLDEAARAADRGVQVETRLVGLAGRDEVLIERLRAPTTAHVGEQLEIVADVRSTVAQAATVRLFADGELVGTTQVQLVAGLNPVPFSVRATAAGLHTFRAVVDAAGDTFGQNNRADALTVVKGPPRILVVAGDAAEAANLVGALRTEDQVVDTTIPESMPSDPSTLTEYDAVVLVDVPRIRLSDRQLLTLQLYVQEFGRGLTVIGGPDTYGAGGFQKTPLEETLPVDMGVRDREKQPDVALVVVIDQSGSMDACHCNSFDGGGGSGQPGGPRKVDIGKEAILRAAAALTARDELGVVGFNESAHWAVRTAPLGTIDDLQGRIAGISPNGQTNIFAGLTEAVSSLEKTSATRRHIILLTDGWSTSGEYDGILGQMKTAGITLSTVGAGGGSNPFLAELAKRGGGRFYSAANPASIPDIFLKETQQVAGQQIVEEPFHPIITGSSPILRGLDEGFPQLLGYNGTTAKPAANTVLVTARDDPLLAQWQYGLGRAVAWTSDSTGHWAAPWLGWSGFTRFFSQAVAWTLPGEETSGIETDLVDRGGRTYLRVESVNDDGSPRDFYTTLATLVGPDLTSLDARFVQVAPGVYEAPLEALQPGAYAVRITQVKPGATSLGRTLGLVAPTATEYRLLGPNEAFLASLRNATGGRAIDLPDDVWRHDLAATAAYTQLWPALLILALLLWPLDVALRRVSLGRRELREWRAAIGDARRQRAAPAPRPAESTAMLAARDRATAAGARAAIRRAAGPAAGPSTPGPAAGPSTPGPAAGPSTPPPAGPRAPQAGGDAARPPAPGGATRPAAPGGQPPADAGDDDDPMARLRAAKRRARNR